MIRFLLILVAAFVVMEFVSYVAHRWIYHKLLWALHKSHHRPRKGLFEWNDVFPLTFASIAIVLMWYAVGDPGRSDILALTLGVTMYGIVYLVIHDLYVHRRMKSLAFRVPYLQQVKKAHMVHHQTGGEPYGLLLFTTPRRLRDAAPDVPLDAIPVDRETRE
jgi:beta-carotene 3-hydroxylase